MKRQTKMQIRNHYFYKYCCVWNKETGKTKQYPIKLAPESEPKVALDRKKVVENIFSQLKRSNIPHSIKDYQFKWLSDDGKQGFKEPLTIKQGYELYTSKKKTSTKSKSITDYSLKHIMSILGGAMPCEKISAKNLMLYVSKQQSNGRSDTSINMDLRYLRTMLYYLKEIEEIDTTPPFKRALAECPVNAQDPIYITELEFRLILNEEWGLLHTHKRLYYKRVFQLYWDLGFRLSEPFLSRIEGNYLSIPKIKNGKARKIRINEEQRLIIEEMQENYAKKPTRDHIMNYSKVFKKALRHCEIDESKHFHSLRHSYGLRRRIETNGNLQKVMVEMGHCDYKTTLKYQRCEEHLLADDFPSLRYLIESVENGSNMPYSTRNHSTNNDLLLYNPPRQMN